MEYVDFEKVTSSSNYAARLRVIYDPTSTAETQTVELQLWLSKTDKNYERKQHTWGVSFYINTIGGPIQHSVQTLPDDNAQQGVDSAGYLLMKKGSWYKWGKSCYITVDNNGQPRTFSALFECVETIPRNSNGAIAGSIKFPQYIKPDPTPTPIIPPAPKGYSAIFDSATREVEYTWDNADCSYVLIWSNWYDNAGKNVKPNTDGTLTGGYVYVTDANGTKRKTLYNVDKNAGIVKEIIPDNVVRVEWQMENVSTTGHGTRAPAQALNVEHKLWVKLPDGTFKKAIPWVKLPDGTFKKAIPWVKLPDGTWMRTTI